MNYHIGSISIYTNGKCRCRACKAAWRIHNRDYLRRHPEQLELQKERMANKRAIRKAQIAALEEPNDN